MLVRRRYRVSEVYSFRLYTGVGGLSLGGGYSWKTNQFGLTIDTVVALQLVLPSGEQINVTNSSNPDLFFALRVRDFLEQLQKKVH